VAGIFLFIGFSFAMSMIQSTISMPFLLSFENFSVHFYLYFATIFSIIQIIAFALIGLAVLRKQDL
jgi:hypothetical protein